MLNETQTLEHAGISDGEMLGVVIRRNPAPRPTGPQAPARPAQPDPEGVRQHFLMSPQAQNDLRQRDPELAAALSDPTRWREAFAMRQRQADEAERERQNQIALLNEDPFNVEAQRKIEELIRQDRVVENLQEAYERNPEGMYYSISHCASNPKRVPVFVKHIAHEIQYSYASTCYTSTRKSMACLSRLSSILAPRRPSCLQIVPRDVVSCA